MKSLELFHFKGRQVRTIQLDGEPWFVAADVCRVLGIQNPTQVCAKLDDDERAMFNIGRQSESKCSTPFGIRD